MILSVEISPQDPRLGQFPAPGRGLQAIWRSIRTGVDWPAGIAASLEIMDLPQYRIPLVKFPNAARLVYRAGHAAQLFAEIQARRNGKRIEPRKESLLEPTWQFRLIAKIYDIQGPIRRKSPGGALEYCLPVRNHGQSVGDHNTVKSIHAK